MNITNLTVKKADGTTDITYTGVSPSSGDGVPAIWKSQTVGNALSHQPELRISARNGGKGGVNRVFRLTFQYPETATNSTTGLTYVVRALPIAMDVPIPKDMPTATVSEALKQFANLLDHADIQAVLLSGYSAT